MLSKSATMLLGLITHQPLNAYEIVKTLDYMNIKYWFNIGTSTVYATIKTLEKKQYLVGEIQKDGNMPDKTVYSITEQGKAVFLETLRTSFLKFDYDTNIFSIKFLVTVQPYIFLPACSGQEALGVCLMKI